MPGRSSTASKASSRNASTGRYRPGRRDWIKEKHRSYWPFRHESEAVQRSARCRATHRDVSVRTARTSDGRTLR
jgi:hypothetical protein